MDFAAHIGAHGMAGTDGARRDVSNSDHHDDSMETVITTSRDPDGGRDAPVTSTPRYSRRLSDKVLIAFHHACDQSDFEIAEQLLRILETMLTRRPLTPDGNRRRSMESLVAAYERLWHLRHPGEDQF
jgi:hypothetical protein